MAILCLSLLFICTAVYSAPESLYGVYPAAEPKGWDINSVSLDPITGTISDICDNFFLTADSTVNVGVSALDPNTGVYMYATDFGQNLVYQTNVYSGKPLPALDLNAATILHITADPPNHRFILLVQNAETDAMQVLSIDETNNTVTKFATPPSMTNLAYPSSGFMDSKADEYVLLASTEVNLTSPKYRTFRFSSSGVLTKTGPVIHTGAFQVVRAVADPNSTGVVALMANADMTQTVMASIDLNGNAHITKLSSVTPDGVATCATFSVSNQTMYFIEDSSNSASYLHAFSLETLEDKTVPINGSWFFYNLEASV